MKKLILSLALASLFSVTAFAQEKPATAKEAVHIYNPQANAQADIDAAVAKAAKLNKNVLVQVGGNWCIWCIRFHDLVNKTPELNKYLNDNFEWVLVNYSPEVKNTAALTKLGNPGRFGYPVFVVLNGKGEVLHIQDSGYLERDQDESKTEGPGHSVKKIQAFLKNWTTAAVAAPAKS
jgi:thiol:disulfide interchange protein